MARSWLGLLTAVMVVAVVAVVAGCGDGKGGFLTQDASTVDAGPLPDAAPPADAGPATPKCLTSAERAASCEITIHATLTQFETGSAPAGNVDLAYNTAWDVPQVFPTTCTPLAMMTATPSVGATFTNVTCSSPVPFVVALMADDPAGGADGLVLSINDRRIPAPDATGVRRLDPFRVFVLSRATFDGWKQAPGLSTVDWNTHGVAVVTFRDAATAPVASVRVIEVNPVTGGQRVLQAGRDVFFLAADNTTIENGRMLTSASGTAVIPLFSGQEFFVTGTVTSGTPIAFEARSGLSTAAGAVFFEQIDPR